MSQFTRLLTTSAIAATAFIVANPLTAQAIPQKSRNACMARTAEEFGESVFNVAIDSVGPVSAESGATTLLMKNKKTGATAECRVSTIDHTVLSFDLNEKTPVSQNHAVPEINPIPEGFEVTTGNCYVHFNPSGGLIYVAEKCNDSQVNEAKKATQSYVKEQSGSGSEHPSNSNLKG